MRGLVQGPRKKKNMERMVEKVANADYQAMQQFITDSPWDADGVFDQVALDANERLPRNGNRRLAVDESAFAKKGEESVGVARQWNGRLGKVDNCQVGVFASLGAEGHDVLVNAKLYLPGEWANDWGRCKKVRIPAADQVCVPKHVMALQMVKHARDLRLEFDWVAADAGYGHIPAFICGFDETFFWLTFTRTKYTCPPRPSVPVANHRGNQRRNRSYETA
jgi:SRSO17 transposase